MKTLGAIIERLTGQHWAEDLARWTVALHGSRLLDAPAIVLLANAEPVDLDRVEAAITVAWYGAVEPTRSH